MTREEIARLSKRLREATGTPPETAVASSRRGVQRWFAGVAPLIRWDVVESPLGPLYLAASEGGLCSIGLGTSEEDFIAQLDPLARTGRDPAALAPVADQLRAYFAGAATHFDIALDLSRVTPFQASVFEVTRRILAGSVWTYGQVARAIGKPQASRAVGQALRRNPIPIVIPCHRVIASDGSLGGYSGGGLANKRLLLRLEGAL